MNKEMFTRVLALLLSISLVGCSSPSKNNVEPSSVYETSVTEPPISINVTPETTAYAVEQEDSIIEEPEKVVEDTEPTLSDEEIRAAEYERQRSEEEARLRAEEEKKLDEQRNSFSMMYYLAITAEEIRTSKDNRLILEDIYTSLLNDINPGAVDEITQSHLRNLRDIIKSYLNISVKRERLQFIHNQEKAAAMRSAVPNPLAILSVSNALNWKKLALTVVYTAVDSYNNYKRVGENADMAFIMSGWELDDEEKDTVMKNRDRAFDYMVDMVQEYNLDGLKTLNEKAIEKFAEITGIANPSERIKLLKAEEQTYSMLGNYWLELANAYFETDQYKKCLECVDEYNDLATGIYRKDFIYVQILPKAIVAAQEIYSGEQYIATTSGFADAIISNTTTDDWSVRYFAAQVYLDLYAKTNDVAYLNKAYKIASENVTVLLKEQRKLNNAYLSDIVEQTIVEPDYRYMTDTEKKVAKQEYKGELKRVKDYNKGLRESRKTELPSLYEPLILNCDLLFALADKIDIGVEDRAELDAILETETCGVFLVKPINDAYSFGENSTKNTIELTKNQLIIPADLLTAEASISVTVTDNGDKTVIDDCVVSKVERQGTTADTFKAYISSKKLEKYKWTTSSIITVTISYADANQKTATFKFDVSSFEEHWYGNKVEFNAR